MSITEKSLTEMHESLLLTKIRGKNLLEQPDARLSPLKAWEELANFPRLGEMASIHQGIIYRIPYAGQETKLFADSPGPGFIRGLRQVTQDFAPYEVKTRCYLNVDPQLQQHEATALLDWSEPKVLVNAHPLGTPRWPLAAALDMEGLVCSEHFHAVWPTDQQLPTEVLAVLLNSPIANAWLSQHHTGRHNPIHILNQIPIPSFSKSRARLFTSLVQEYLSQREHGRLGPECAGQCAGLLGRIDEELLRLYNLSLHAERELLAYFEGYRRPGHLTQVKPSLPNEMRLTYIHVQDVRVEGEEKIIDVFIPCWRADDPEKIIQLPLSPLPAEIQEQVGPESTLQAKVNTGTEDEKNLIFEEFELLPEIDEEEILAHFMRAA